MKLFLRCAIALSIAIITPHAYSQATNFTDWIANTSGPWETSTNWSNGVPNSSTEAFLFPGIFTTSVTINAADTAQTLVVDGFVNSGTVSSAANITLGASGSLTIVGESPADFVSNLDITNGAVLNTSGGSILLKDGLISVGDTSGGGTWNINSGSFSYDFQTTPDITQMNVGTQGSTGMLAQSGGSKVTIGNELFIGSDGGTGIYGISGGSTLQTGILLPPASYFVGIGVNEQTSQTSIGTLTISDTSKLTMGPNSLLVLGTVATLDGNPLPVGIQGGQGFITQDGGTVTMQTGSELLVGSHTGGSGTYLLKGGEIDLTDAIFVIGNASSTTGTLTQTGGVLKNQGTTFFAVGYSGTGTYSLSGDSTVTADFAGGLTVGSQTGSVGTLTQSGGTITAENTAIIGESGTGTYNMSGGSATFAAGLIVGQNPGATGLVIQTGGQVTISSGQTLNLGQSNSIYNLNGGTLIVGNAGVTNGINGSGAFNLGGGTLMVGASGSLTDSFNSTLTNISTIDTTNGNAAISGNLTGSGGLIITGSHTVNLTGANSYTGGTSVNGGTLNAGVTSLPLNGSQLTIGTGATLNLSALPLSAQVLTGPLSGGGTFNLIGTYSMELANATNFTGSIAIGSNGTLQVFNGTFGNISGAGANLIVGGDSSVATSGTVNFLGSNSYTGSTTISPNFTVTAGGVGGSLTNYGTLGITPTLPVGTTFSIGGGLAGIGTFLQTTQNVGGPTPILIVRTNGQSADNFVAHSANISGTLYVSGAGSKQYSVVVTPGGGLTLGAIQVVTLGSPLLFSAVASPIPVVDPITGNESLVITTTQNFLSSYALTHNQLAVAHSLDMVIQSPPVSAAPLFTAINNTQTAAQIPNILDQLSPESLQYMRDIAFESSTFMSQRLNGQLARIRNGYSGLDTSGLSIVNPGLSSGLGRSLDSLLAYYAPAPNGVNYYPVDDSPPIGAPSMAPEGSSDSKAVRTISDSPDTLDNTSSGFNKWHRPSTRFTEFISGDFVQANLNESQSASNAPSSKASYVGANATGGIGFHMTSNLVAGVLFDYNHTNANTDNQGSHIRADSYTPGVYATFYEHGFYANGLFGFGINNYSNNRVINFNGLNANATSSPNGTQYTGNLDFGYDFQPDKHWIVGPTLGVTYSQLDLGSYTESGASSADLSVNSLTEDSLRSRLGGHVIYQTNTGFLLLQPSFTAMWQHEYLNTSNGITSQLNVPGTAPFTIQTTTLGRDSALLGAGLTATLDNSMALYLNYLADVGTDNYFAQTVEGGFKASF